MMLSLKLLSAWIVSIGAVLILGNHAVANPTGTKPYQPLAVHGTIEGAKAEVARLYELYQQQEKTLLLGEKRKSNPASIPATQLAKIYAESWRAGQQATHLTLMGEPAGGDLQKKFGLIQTESRVLIELYRKTPKGAQVVKKILQQLKRQKPAVDRFLRQADKAVADGKLDSFEKLMYAKGMPLLERCVYLTSNEQKPYWQPFTIVLKRGVNRLNETRRQEYLAMGAAEIAKQIRGATEFAAAANRIRAEIAATGKATLSEGVEGDAAESLGHVVDLWAKASLGLCRAAALQWAFTNQATVNIQPTPEKLESDATNALVSLIEAAAESPNQSDIPRLYSNLLKQVTYADRRSSESTDLIQKCRPALNQLAAKDPNLPARLSAYRRATQEPLSWRRAFAAQQAERLSDDFRSTHSMMGSKDPVVSSGGVSSLRSLRSGFETAAPTTFRSTADSMVQQAAASLVNAPVTAESAIRLTPTSRTIVTPIQVQCYVSSSVPEPSEAQLADLRTSLVVSDTHGPLSLAAADAISSAELRDFVAIGGLIREIHLESLVTRFATIPDVASALIPLGESAAMPQLAFPRMQTCWRLNIDPQWAHHEYFTVRVDPNTN